jgi:hypothetical protein
MEVPVLRILRFSFCLLLVFLTACAPKHYDGIAKVAVYSGQVADGILMVQNTTEIAVDNNVLDVATGQKIIRTTLVATAAGKEFTAALRTGDLDSAKRRAFIETIKGLLQSTLSFLDESKQAMYSVILYGINFALDQLK